jgi:hypothetical protein
MDVISLLSEKSLEKLAGYTVPATVSMPLDGDIAKELAYDQSTRTSHPVPQGAGGPNIKTLKTLQSIGQRKSYWNDLQREMRIFLCTEDKKYADIKNKLTMAGGK